MNVALIFSSCPISQKAALLQAKLQSLRGATELSPRHAAAGSKGRADHMGGVFSPPVLLLLLLFVILGLHLWTCGILEVPRLGAESELQLPAYTTATGLLHRSYSNARSEPRLQPTPQLTATPDP